jgi:hypothetical protein
MGLLTLHLTSDLPFPVVAGTVASAAKTTSNDTATSLWVVLAVTLLGSSVVAGLITSVVGHLRAAATDRREGYANAVRALIARGEYPYRVRRRVSDDPDVLAALVSRGHQLQEELAACRTWVASEHRKVGDLFDKALADVDATVKPATADAWNQPPIKSAAAMNLNGWGPGDQWHHLASLERAIAYRFGWRRILPRGRWNLDA